MEAEKYAVRGSIRSIVKRSANVKDVFYTFELSLTDKQRGVEVWSEDQEIRKVSGR
jgi:PBP1b-binding outer membrane lipoprotein LpoB